MDEAQQGIQFHEALVAHGAIEEDPEVEQEASHGIEPDEYTDTDYQFDESDEDMEDGRDTDEVPDEPPTTEVHQDHRVLSGDPVDGTLSLK